MTIGYSLFPSTIGTLGIAWGEGGLTAIKLPEASDGELLSKLGALAAGGAPATPPAWVGRAIGQIQAHLDGKRADLSRIKLDDARLPAFHRAAYSAIRATAPGATITYGELAARLGSPGAARAVGQAMAKNPFPIVVPCHRVLAASGKPGGFSAVGGAVTKARILSIEGVTLGRAGKPAPSAKPAPAGDALPPLFRGAGALGCRLEDAIPSLRKADKRLATLIDRVGPCTLKVEMAHSPFSALCQSIVYQQLTGKAAATIFGRLEALYAGGRITPELLLSTDEDLLRGAGLSRSKVAAVRDLAQKTLDGVVPSFAVLEGMDEEAIIERLTAVRGVGRWTAEMLLIFRLGRPDVLPLGDYGVRKGYAIAFGKKDLPSEAQLREAGLAWAPYRTIASWYLWRANDL